MQDIWNVNRIDVVSIISYPCVSAFQKHLSLSSCAPLAQYFSANGYLVCDYLKLHQISLLPVFTPLVVSVTMQLASCISVNILLLGLSTCWCCLLYVVNIGIKCMFQCKSVAGGWLRKEGIVRHPYAFILEGGGQLIQKLAWKDNFIGHQHQGVGSGTTKVLYIIGLHNKLLSGHLRFYYVMKITFELSHHFTWCIL